MPSSSAADVAGRSPGSAPAPARDGWLVALWIVIAAWILLFTTLAFRLHTAMRTHKADLGQVAQAVWNSSRGRFVEQTDNGFIATRLTDHVEPILALISPVLWIWEDTRALLLLQVIFVAVGAWLVYDLALVRLGRVLKANEWGQVWMRDPLLAQTRPLAFALALAWLLAPQLQSAVLTEFHAVPLAAPLILWAFWAIEMRRWTHFSVAALLVAATKEETALLAALLGLWAIWRAWGMQREARADSGEAGTRAPVSNNAGARRFARPIHPGYWWGTAVALLSLVWFGVATFVIVPAHAAELYGVAESGYFARYGALGDSPLDIVRSFFTQPAVVSGILSEPVRLSYLLRLLAAFAFLPLLAPELVLLSLPVLLANMLSAYPAQYFGEFHYSAPVVPFFAAAAAFGLGRVWAWLWRSTRTSSPAFQHMSAAGAGTMALATAVRNPATALRPILTTVLFVWIAGWGIYSYVDAGRGPGGGRYDAVTVSDHHRLLPALLAQVPHGAAVTATAAVHPHLAMRRFIYQFPLGIEVDAPAQPADWALIDVTTNTDMAPGDLRARVNQMLAEGWSVQDAQDGFLLLHRGAGPSKIPASFYSFTLPQADAPSEPSALDWPRWRQSQLVASWPTAANADLRVTTPEGATVYTLETSAPAALLWREQAHADGVLSTDQLLLAVTPAQTLPRTVLVESDVEVGGIVMRRTRGDALTSLPVAALEKGDYAQALAKLTGFRLTSAQGEVPGPEPLTVTMWSEQRATWPGDTVDIWLQWQGDVWSTASAPRLELRHNGATVAMSEGEPRLFGRVQAAALAGGFANDWRTLTLPTDLDAGGDWTVELVDKSGATVAALPLKVRTHRPDQACALLPATCASQSE